MLGTSPLWRSTVAFTYLKFKSAKWLCLLPVRGLGLENLALFTSLTSGVAYFFTICQTPVFFFNLVTSLRSRQSTTRDKNIL